MNHPLTPGMANSAFNSNPSFSPMPNVIYPHTSFNGQFAPFDTINRNPAPNRYPNPGSSAPFPPSFISPLAGNNNRGALSVPSVMPPGISSSNDSFTFTPQNNVETLKKLDLGETIRVFKQLISHAETTVRQISDLVKLNPSDCGKFSVCPFDSNHRMRAEHLFRHSLCCLSSPGVVGLDILSTVRYPGTLRSEKDLRDKSQVQLFKPLPGSAADICIAIEEEEGLLGSDFFYKDAPGVVSLSQGEIKKTFSLPNVLYTECVDSDSENAWLTGNCNVSLLPSEFVTLRSELTSWNGFPSRYRFVTLLAAMGLGKIKESEIIDWIILNSPVFGIIIDLPMAGHIALLSKLCLKAISLEAFGIYQKEIEIKDVRQNHDGKEIDTNISTTTTNKFSSLQTTYFDCPVLLESVTWLASEMSTLYGQACGRSFVIGMLQHSFVCAGKALSYSVVGKLQTITETLDVTEASSAVHNSDVKENATKDGTSNAIVEKNLPKSSCIICSEVASGDACEHGDGLISESRVFVSQVAAAVAALLERFLLEERIKGLRHLRRLSKFQLFTEHDIAVKNAVEEREKRLNYKPILEHDGLVWQRSYQDSKKHKTREQLLAEERDYKRRRMSYRGKKVKRTPTKVLHDIIEGHMEEIRVAGGIGCFVKGASETPQIGMGSINLDGMGQNTQELRNPNSFLSDTGERLAFRRHYPMTFDNRANSSKGLISEMDMKTTKFGDGNRPKNHKRNSHDQHYDNGEHYNAKLSHDDDFYHYSGHSSEKMQGHETKHHSRSLHRSPDIHGERNSRSHCEHENRHRSRSQERKHESMHQSTSHECKRESGHVSRSRERRHESRHRSRSLEHQHESRHRSRSNDHKHQRRHRSRSRDDKHERRHRRRSLERKQSDSNDFERWQLT